MLAVLLFFQLLSSQKREMRPADRFRIAEAHGLARSLADSVWKGWHQAPFPIVLVYDETEFLVYHDRPTKDFKVLGYDAVLGDTVYFRPRQFRKDFLATFPAVNGVATIVVGTPENTGLSSSHWIITLLHEHFHQWQFSRPDYYPKNSALDLSGGDQTGMWTLMYAFPYDSVPVKEQLKTLGTALSDQDWDRFRAEKEKLKELLSERDYRYLNFQLWQEGMARYTEQKLAELAARSFDVSPGVRALPDFMEFRSLADTLRENILKKNKTLDPANMRRDIVYWLGAAEGFLLDKHRPGWRDRYLDKFFDTDVLRQ